MLAASTAGTTETALIARCLEQGICPMLHQLTREKDALSEMLSKGPVGPARSGMMQQRVEALTPKELDALMTLATACESHAHNADAALDSRPISFDATVWAGGHGSTSARRYLPSHWRPEISLTANSGPVRSFS
eukprot:2116004-Prymnesium_polylepis.2